MNTSSAVEPGGYTPPFTSGMVIGSIYDLFWLLGCVAVAFVAVWLCFWLFNRLPATWYCDYREKPSPELYGTRLYFRPVGVAASLLMGLYFILLYYQYGGSVYFYLNILSGLGLMMITLADYQYSIIPDQFTLFFLVVAAFTAWYDFANGQLYGNTWWSPIAGGLAGAGAMLCIGVVGSLIYKKTGVGFGDVKLFLALGVLAGWPQVLVVFFFSLCLACVHFVIMLLMKKVKGDVYFPMGPYICIAMMGYLAFRSQIQQGLDWYVSLIV